MSLEIALRQERHHHLLRQGAEAADHLRHKKSKQALRCLFDAAAKFHIEGLYDAASLHPHKVAVGVARLLHNREDIHLVDGSTDDKTLGVVTLEQLHPFLIDIGLLEAQLGGRSLHRSLVLPDDLGHPALQDGGDGVYLLIVGLL